MNAKNPKVIKTALVSERMLLNIYTSMFRTGYPPPTAGDFLHEILMRLDLHECDRCPGRTVVDDQQVLDDY